MIYEINDTYAISSYGIWKPGVYSSERAAKYAFRFKNEYLFKLQNTKNLNKDDSLKVISFKDLQELKKILKDE